VSYLRPVLCTMSMHLLDKQAIFLFRPRAFDHLRIKYFLPAMKTLHICAVLKSLSNSFPVFWAHLANEFSQFFVLQIKLEIFKQTRQIILGKQKRSGNITYLSFSPVSFLCLSQISGMLNLNVQAKLRARCLPQLWAPRLRRALAI
jgi:hypothetical protein